jgi:hypothetical protein
MIISIIPIIKNIKNPFFVSIFYSPLIIIIIVIEVIMSIIPIIKNLFFVSIFYSLSNIINILINKTLLFKIVQNKRISFFSFISFDCEQKLSFFGGFPNW